MLLADDGSLLVLTGREARLLVGLLAPGLARVRADRVELRPELAAVVRGITEAARADHQRAATAVAEHGGTVGILPGRSGATVEGMTTADVAELLGCTTRNVTALAERRTLAGRRTPRGWRFDPADVEEFLEARAS